MTGTGQPQPAKVSFAAVPPTRRQGGEFRFALTPRTVTARSGLTGRLDLAPGHAVIEHYHPYSDESLVVLCGYLVVRHAGGVLLAGADDCVLVPKGVRHRFENPGTEQLRAVVHLSPLAPDPSLGHVDCEALPCPDEPPEIVGGLR